MPALHWSLASAAILMAVFFAWKRPLTKPVVEALASPARVAILPFTDSNEDRELGLVVLSISDLLEQRLAQVPRIHVRGPDYSRDLSVTSASLAEFASRAGVDHVISGNVHRTADGKKAHFVLTLHQLLKGRVRETPLGRFDVPFMRTSGELAEYTSVRDAMVKQIVATLSPALGKNAVGNNALVPHESDAYRFYLLGRSRLAGGVCDGGALELLERSLEIDRRFAPAWEAYGWALYGLSSSCGRGNDGYRKAIEAADHCLALAPEMSSAVGLKATVLVETGRVEDAYRLLKDVERRAPQSAEVQSFLFYVLDYAGYLEQAKTHLERLTRMDPHFLTQRGWTPNPYLYLGDTDRFLRTLAGSDTPLFRYYRGVAKLAAGQKKEAYESVAPAFRLNPSDAFARLSEAMAAVLEEKPEEAREIIRHIVREREAVDATDGEMTYKVAQLFALSGDHLAALAQLEKAVDQGFFCASCFDRDPFLAAARTAPPYARIAAKARERHAAFGRQFGLKAESRPATLPGS
jgi:tetratricopeptide (TPR) repeat protein/TolB-like protein